MLTLRIRSILCENTRQIVNAANRSQVLMRYAGQQHVCHFVLLFCLSELDLGRDVSECHDLACDVVEHQLLLHDLNCLLRCTFLVQRDVNHFV